MYIIFLVVLFGLLTFQVICSALSEKKLKGVIFTEKMRCKDYITTMIFLWLYVIIILLMCFIGNIRLSDIGLRGMSFDYNIWFTVITLSVCGILICYLIYQTITLIVSPKAREEAKELDTGEGASRILPHSKKEKGIFIFVCATAGICEEIVFRGFLVFLIHAIFPSLSIIFVILISSLIFGCAHLYQGIVGILKTGAMGVLFNCLVVVSGSLILAIIMHFLVDFSSTFLFSDDKKEISEEKINEITEEGSEMSVERERLEEGSETTNGKMD